MHPSLLEAFMNRNITSTLIYIVIVQILLFTNAKTQVQLLWTSPTTSGFYKGALYEVGSSSIRYFYTIDTSTHECNLYNSDNFSLAYTITNVGNSDDPYYCLNDMNGNGSPEVFFYSSPAKIRDAKTGAVIYSWTASDVFQWIGTTPGSNTIKIAFRNPITGNSSLSVYSLGITTGVTERT